MQKTAHGIKTRVSSIFIACFVFGALFIFERLLKLLAAARLSENQTEGFFIISSLGLRLFKNKNFFGIVALPSFFGIALMIIFLIFIFTLLRKELAGGKKVAALWLSLALIGALSNTIDRVFLGQVIDYLVIGPWAINLADMLIVSGLIMYLKDSKF
ncbi:signal peptidase II [Candidatus Uhrbacteria bacterium]|nr:signal peptidase II [Candidatus Uhrbacteria bacterium]